MQDFLYRFVDKPLEREITGYRASSSNLAYTRITFASAW